LLTMRPNRTNETDTPNEMTIDHAELIRAMPLPFLAYEPKPPYRIIDQRSV